MEIRKEHEPPAALEQWGWKFHHLGIPTLLEFPDEQYIPQLKFYVSGFSSSPFGIEWMRFEKDCSLDKMIQTIPHIAFEVADLDHELLFHNLNVIIGINSPAEGIRVAVVEHNGAPIELIEFEKNKR
jgi:hypothetical protein